jgi:hypothetical protein
MSDEPTPDPFLDAEVTSALAPYRAMGLSRELLAEMEQMLRLALTSHPTGKYLMSRLRPRMVEQSGAGPTAALNGAAKAGSGR